MSKTNVFCAACLLSVLSLSYCRDGVASLLSGALAAPQNVAVCGCAIGETVGTSAVMAAIDSLLAADALAEIAAVPLAASSTWFRRLVGVAILALATIALIVGRYSHRNVTLLKQGAARERFSPTSEQAVGGRIPTRIHFLVLACIWTALVIYGSLTPANFTDTSLDEAVETVQHMPLLSFDSRRRVDWVSNFSLFVPMGFLWYAIAIFDRNRKVWRWGAACFVLLACFLLSIAVEFAQIWVPTRTTSQNDVLAQLIGTTGGIFLWHAFGQTVSKWVRDHSPAVRPMQPIDWLLRLYFFGLLIDRAMPLDLTIHPVELYDKFRSGMVEFVPFVTHNFTALSLAFDVSLFVPVGALTTITWTTLDRPTRSIEASVTTGCIIVVLIETLQIFVYTRVSTGTDVITGIAGVFLGALLMNYACGRLSLFSPLPPSRPGMAVSRWILVSIVGGILLTTAYWRPWELSAGEVQELRESIAAQVTDAFAGRTSPPELPRGVPAIGVQGPVGCDSKHKTVKRLIIEKPGVYENILVDGRWTDRTLVKIPVDGVILRRCEIRNGTHNGISVYANDVMIDSCRIHHVLKGLFQKQQDAHGITGRPTNLIIRNCEIYQLSGDGIQFDPNRDPWDRVLVENCTIWTAPLDAAAAGFKRGERPGENGVDTKQRKSNPRSRMFIRNCLFYGWGEGQITNQAALNLKENVDVRVENCAFRNNDICFRLRGEANRSRGGALVTIQRCAVYDSLLAARMEDRISHLKIRRLGIGKGVRQKYYIDKGKIGLGYENTGEFKPPPFEAVIRDGVPAAARRYPAKNR